MHFSTLLTLAAVSLTATAMPYSEYGYGQLLPTCSAISTLPCQCPSGTTYGESVTTAIIGAPVAAFEAVTNNFYDPSWGGLVPYQTQGPDNVPGISTRSLHVQIGGGQYNITERLLERIVVGGGSFIQRFAMINVPLEFDSGNGFFGGYWITLEGRRIFENETLAILSGYSCETGHVTNFAEFHENALKNVANILQREGKLVGVTAQPESAQSFLTTTTPPSQVVPSVLDRLSPSRVAILESWMPKFLLVQTPWGRNQGFDL